MRTRPFPGRLTAIALTLVLSCGLFAQQPQAAGTTESCAALSKQAHQLANTAKTLQEFTEALRILGKAAKANPTPEQSAYINKLAGWSYNKRGETLVKLAEETAGADQKRAAEYEQAAINDFGLAIRFDQEQWKPRFNRAVSIAVLGDYKTALTDLEFVLQKQPTHKNALFNRGEILLQLGEYERAVTDYSKVIEQDANDAAAYAGRGIALSAIGDSTKAMLDLNSVIRLQPENATAYVDRADLHASMGNWERAAGDYRVAIGLDDSIGRAYQNVAWLMSTCPEKRFRNPALAVRAAKKALELEGKNYLGLDTLAAALASTGDFRQAYTVQQQALAGAPKNEQTELSQRLDLYKRERPFIERPVDSNVRLASGQEDAAK